MDLSLIFFGTVASLGILLNWFLRLETVSKTIVICHINHYQKLI